MGKRTAQWISKARQNEIYNAAFEAANLHEVAKESLLPGQYTNKRIIRILGTDHHTFLRLLLNLPRDPDPSVRRSALSRAVYEYKKRTRSR